jgi:hypothetical protein
MKRFVISNQKRFCAVTKTIVFFGFCLACTYAVLFLLFGQNTHEDLHNPKLSVMSTIVVEKGMFRSDPAKSIQVDLHLEPPLKLSESQKQDPSTPVGSSLVATHIPQTVPAPVHNPPVVQFPRKIILSRLVSLHKPAISDVRGNLGPASVITNETMTDWLKDRWQGKDLTQPVLQSRYLMQIF